MLRLRRDVHHSARLENTPTAEAPTSAQSEALRPWHAVQRLRVAVPRPATSSDTSQAQGGVPANAGGEAAAYGRRRGEPGTRRRRGAEQGQTRARALQGHGRDPRHASRWAPAQASPPGRRKMAVLGACSPLGRPGRSGWSGPLLRQGRPGSSFTCSPGTEDLTICSARSSVRPCWSRGTSSC